jgi:hypothetical protein
MPATANTITAEIVKGKKEELYWEKVPEKVRKLAVQKQTSSGSAQMDKGGLNEEGEKEERKRKRRKQFSCY